MYGSIRTINNPGSNVNFVSLINYNNQLEAKWKITGEKK
jgi:hypothetical protein